MCVCFSLKTGSISFNLEQTSTIHRNENISEPKPKESDAKTNIRNVCFVCLFAHSSAHSLQSVCRLFIYVFGRKDGYTSTSTKHAATTGEKFNKNNAAEQRDSGGAMRCKLLLRTLFLVGLVAHFTNYFFVCSCCHFVPFFLVAANRILLPIKDTKSACCDFRGYLPEKQITHIYIT